MMMVMKVIWGRGKEMDQVIRITSSLRSMTERIHWFNEVICISRMMMILIRMIRQI